MAQSIVFLVSFILLGPCYINCCPLPGGCTDLPNARTFVTNIEMNSPTLNSTVIISHSNIKFRNIDVKRDLNNRPSSNVFEGNCTGTAMEHARFNPSWLGDSSRCPWHYVCDYNPQRIPPFIYHARCNSTAPLDNSYTERCGEVYSMQVYLTTESCEPLATESGTQWTAHSAMVPVACAIVNFE